MTKTATLAMGEATPAITRRTAMVGAIASSAAAVVAMPHAARALEPSPLPGLIAAHRMANEAFEAACDGQEAAETRFKATLSPIVALSLTPDGTRPSGGLEYRVCSDQSIEDEIRKTHDALRERHCGRYVQKMAPDLAQAMAEAIDVSLAASLAELAETERQERELADKLGVTAADQQWEDKLQAENDAILAVLAYVPRTPDDRRIKADWVLSFGQSRNYYFDAEMMAALAASIAGGEA